MEKSVTDNRTLEEIKDDIYEIASWGYNQKEAQEWAKNEVDKAIKKRIAQEIPKNLEADTRNERGEI